MNNYVFTQDGAPAHTFKKAQEFCKGNMASFWPADFWPPHRRIVEALKAIITKEWDNMSEDFIKTSCAS
ncbi:Uncharacterized protein FKW44_006968, partial [Caligus rogercresseyi]